MPGFSSGAWRTSVPESVTAVLNLRRISSGGSVMRTTPCGAPRVVAAGSGIVAERIVALAREHGVPVHDDAGLAEALARLQLEAEVPEELWKAVAEALVWAYKLTARAA